MIGLYDDDGDRLAITYNSLTLNDPTDPADDTFEINMVSTLASSDGPQEVRPDDDGSEIYDARKALLVLRIDGTIRAPSLAKLYDKKRLLAAAFDPARCSREDVTDTNGFLALDFSVPTTDTTEWPTGLVPSRYYARARQTPVPVDGPTGNAAFFSIELLVPDPRRYGQAADTLAGAGTANQEGDYRVWPTLTITMAGAGHAAYAIASDPTAAWGTTKTLVLNLSGLVNTDVVTVDMARRRISVDGVETPGIYVSGDYFPLERGNNAVTYTNTTNATSSLAWRRAWTV